MKRSRIGYGLLFLLAFSLGGIQCKKVKEDIARRFIIDAMTSGLWIVQVFKDNNEDITANFRDYEFQFRDNGKVYAIKTATAEQVTGTWEGNVNDLTIFSNFPAAGEPLLRLNDTWKIINNTMKLVEAQPFSTGRSAYLKLVKKE